MSQATFGTSGTQIIFKSMGFLSSHHWFRFFLKLISLTVTRWLLESLVSHPDQTAFREREVISFWTSPYKW